MTIHSNTDFHKKQQTLLYEKKLRQLSAAIRAVESHKPDEEQMSPSEVLSVAKELIDREGFF